LRMKSSHFCVEITKLSELSLVFLCNSDTSSWNVQLFQKSANKLYIQVKKYNIEIGQLSAISWTRNHKY
jgi:hypothetical protein